VLLRSVFNIAILRWDEELDPFGLRELTSFPCSNCKKECASELVGTYSLVLVGPGTVVAVSLVSGLNFPLSFVLIGLSFGVSVGTIIALFGKHSGAHINPAVTVACSVSKKLSPTLLLPYVLFQIAGGLLAGLTLRLVYGSLGSTTNLGSAQLSPSISPSLGIALEAVGTFALVFGIMITSTRVQSVKRQGVIIGTLLFFLILLIGPLTGGSFNPARSLGPSVASGYLTNQLVYWVGPLLGGLTAAYLFNGIQGHATGKTRDDARSLCMC
jgi:MIP family channel proteins